VARLGGVFPSTYENELKRLWYLEEYIKYKGIIVMFTSVQIIEINSNNIIAEYPVELLEMVYTKIISLRLGRKLWIMV
jgi:hypothetical protein